MQTQRSWRRRSIGAVALAAACLLFGTLGTGAANKLHDSIDTYYKTGPWTHEKTERAVIDLCQRIDKYGDRLLMEDLKSDPYCSLIPDLNEDTVQSVQDSIHAKILKGMEKQKNQQQQIYPKQ